MFSPRTFRILLAVTVLLCGCPSNPSASPSRRASSSALAASSGISHAPSPAAWRTWNRGEPIIDSHVHVVPTMFGLARAVEVFDRAGIGRFAVKSGGPYGSPKYAATMAMTKVMGDRMRVFANISWEQVNEPGFAEHQAKLLELAKRDGVVGIKIFKALGLSVRDASGKLIPIDAPQLAPLFDACGKLGLIVAWHVADPVAFFEPVTPNNERYEELRLAPDWSFYGKDYPSHDELLAARDRVIARHPDTVFLLIHLANYPENLANVDRLLDEHPNVYVDTSARVPEFGRHPADEVRRFFIKHQDRILFGSDFIAGADGSMQLGSVSRQDPTVDAAAEFFERHWRYFETKEKQIDHPTPTQGNWKVDAIGLPMPVLRKLYVTNAEALIFSGARPKPYGTSATKP